MLVKLAKVRQDRPLREAIDLARRPVASMSPSPAACRPANERRGALQRSLRQRWRSGKASVACEPLCEMCLTRGQVTAACICDHVEPHGSDWNRFLAHSAAPSPCPIGSVNKHHAARRDAYGGTRDG